MGEDPAVPELESVEELKKALLEEKTKAESYFTSLQRSEADFRNYKKRVEQEKADSIAWSCADLIRSVLPVVDDMERAFRMVDPASQSSTWIQGFRIIQRNLQDVLRANGCTEMECLGVPFDPNYHEAVGYEPGKEGMVISEHRKGYLMKNKVLRAAQVTVGKGNSGNVNKEPGTEA